MSIFLYLGNCLPITIRCQLGSNFQQSAVHFYMAVVTYLSIDAKLNDIMKQIVKAIFRPVANRHYTSKKTSIVIYAFRFFPVLLIGLWGAIFVDPFFWILLAGIVVWAVVDYVVFDALLDKLGWKFLWSRFYTDESRVPSPVEDAMKAYEQNPSPENYKALQNHLKTK